MTRALFPAVLLLACACAPGEAQLSVALPQQMQTLNAADIGGQVQVFRKAQGCAGRPRYQAELQHEGDALTATVQVAPGTHFFCIFYRAGSYELGRYVDIEVEVEVGALVSLSLENYPLQYRDLDDDGDGIANLDELRFGFTIGSADEDSSERVDMPAQVNFMLGADDSEASLVEQPAHLVSVQAFAIDRFEVSRARYRLCVALGRCDPPEPDDVVTYLSIQDPEQLNLPATGVPQAQADIFCRDVAGGALPSEAEWEYAARAGQTRYPWGDTPLAEDRQRCDLVNARYFEGGRELGRSAPCASNALGLPALRAVNYYSASGPGLENACARRPGSTSPDGACQMAGNAWEWTRSAFGPYHGASWEANGIETLAVIRGGSADSLDYSLRSTFRAGVASDLSDTGRLAGLIGFRCIYVP